MSDEVYVSLNRTFNSVALSTQIPGGLYRRDTSGTWAFVSSTSNLWKCYAIEYDPSNSNIIYAFGFKLENQLTSAPYPANPTKLFKSIDHGVTFTEMSLPNPPFGGYNNRTLFIFDVEQALVGIDRNGRIYHAIPPLHTPTDLTNAGLWRSSDSGITWSKIASWIAGAASALGIAGTWVEGNYAYWTQAKESIAGANNDTIYLRRIHIDTLEITDTIIDGYDTTGEGNVGLEGIVGNQDIIWTHAAYQSGNLKVHKTINMAATEIIHPRVEDVLGPYWIHPVSADIVYSHSLSKDDAGVDVVRNRIRKSTNGGLSWSEVFTSSEALGNIAETKRRSISSERTNADTLYALLFDDDIEDTETFRIARSINAGSTWSLENINTPGKWIGEFGPLLVVPPFVPSERRARVPNATVVGA
jgi:hypothetical protein